MSGSYLCPNCDSAFTTLDALRKHRKRMGPFHIRLEPGPEGERKYKAKVDVLLTKLAERLKAKKQ
jgi:hypothetical protein